MKTLLSIIESLQFVAILVVCLIAVLGAYSSFTVFFVAKYKNYSRKLKISEKITKIIFSPISFISISKELTNTDSKKNTTTKKNIVRMLPIYTTFVISAFNYKYLYSILEKVNKYLLNLDFKLHKLENSLIFMINFYAITSFIFILILLSFLIKNKPHFFLIICLILSLITIATVIIYYSTIQQREIEPGLLIGLSYLTIYLFNYICTSYTIVATYKLYRWITPSKRHNKADHKTTIAKLTFLWTILAFILGLLFNFKQ
mgnify:CR=1 FL=1